MKKILWCFVLLGFLVSGVVGYADRIEIDSATTSKVIDGEYGEEATSEAYGVYVEYAPTVYLEFTEDAVGIVSAINGMGNASACGVYSLRDENTIDHSGSLTVTAETDSDDAYVYGVYTEGALSFTNSGDITVRGKSSTGGDAYTSCGVYAYNITSFNNSGYITVTANSYEDDASAYGVTFDYDIKMLENSGTINATATASDYAEAYGISSWGGGDIIILKNTGEITADADGGDIVIARGVYTYTYYGDETGTSDKVNIIGLENSGTITAIANESGFGEVGLQIPEYNILAAGVSTECYGEFLAGEVSGGNIYNLKNTGTGEITAEATGNLPVASGISVLAEGYYYYEGYTTGGNIYNVENAGKITATATGYNPVSAGLSAFSYAWGSPEEDSYVESSGGNIYNLKNTGTGEITAEAIDNVEVDDATAYGVSSYAYAFADYAEASGGNIAGLENAGKITATATSEICSAYGYGVSAYAEVIGYDDGEGYYYPYEAYASGGNITGLTNSGSITVNVTGAEDSEAYGVYSYSYAEGSDYAESSGGNITNLTNSGTISATAEGNYTYSYGIVAFSEAYSYEGSVVSSGGNIENLTNSGNISATAIAISEEVDSVEVPLQGSVAYAYGVFVDSYAYGDSYSEASGGNITNLNNSGTISATAEGDYAYASGIYAEVSDGDVVTGGNIIGLSNSGDIIAEAGGYDEEEEMYLSYSAYSSGIMAYNGVADLSNSGNIISTAKGLYEAYAIGITTQWYINGLTNSGNIIVEAEAGSGAYAGGIMSSEITDLTNSGNITVSAEGYAAFAEGISGLFIDGLTNSGTIKAEAIGKEPMFLGGSQAFAMGIGGTVGIETDIGDAVFTDIVNTGIINASVTTEAVDGGGMAVGIIGSGISSGDGLADGETSTITNEGLILVQFTAPEDLAAPGATRLAGIVITGGDDVRISNPGEIRVESSVDGVEARTLVVVNGASVTIDDSFAITFGSPGVGPDMEPIYVESATLDLNGATLIVRADSRNLQLDTEYYIVENAGGSVDGEWAPELERGYTNESIEVNWVDDEDLGEDAAVIFSYNPEAAAPEDVLAPGMGGLTGTPIIVDSIVQQINPYSPLNVNTLLVKDERKSVLLASNGVSDEGLPGLGATSRYRGFWFMPVYTRLVGEDIGYDANAYGLALGIGGKVSEAGYIGGYVGYAKGFLDFNIDSGDTEEQNIFFGGLSGVYGPNPWYVRFSGLGYYADHSYEGYTGLLYDLDEEADYNGIGCNIEVAVGGSFGDSVRFVPEAGLAYQYGSIDKFETEVDADPSWEREIEPEDINVLKGILGMSVIGGVGSPTQFYLGARLEYALSDNDVSAVNSLIGGTEFDIEKDMDDSLLSVTAGLNHEFGNSWSLEFGLRGDFCDDYNGYTGRMFIRKSF